LLEVTIDVGPGADLLRSPSPCRAEPRWSQPIIEVLLLCD